MTLTEWLSYIESIHPASIDMGLARVQAVGKALGLSLEWPCPVVTVAGTNGKGTTVKTLSTLLQTLGYQVGTYTSPHLIDFSERINLNLQPASEAQLIDAFAKIDQTRLDLGQTLTYFEFTTLAAFLIFKAQPLDVLVLEIGLGGRLDAVNMIEPDVSIITTIGLDHQDYLGDTLDKIAAEKAGVMRAHKPVILGEGAYLPTLITLAEHKQAQLYVRGRDFDDAPIVSGKGKETADVFPESVQLAIQALKLLAPKIGLKSDKIERICDHFPEVNLVGRCQRMMFNQTEWIIDVAHNGHAANWLAGKLNDAPTVRATHIVWCSFVDKDLDSILSAFMSKLSFEQKQTCHWHIGALDHSRSALKTALFSLKDRYLSGQIRQVEVLDTFEQALNQAYNQAKSCDRIVVFGSFQAVNEALAYMKTRVGK